MDEANLNSRQDTDLTSMWRTEGADCTWKKKKYDNLDMLPKYF